MPELLTTSDRIDTGDQKLRDDREMLKNGGPIKPELVSSKPMEQFEAETRQTHIPELVLGNQKQRDDREMIESLESSKPESVLGKQQRREVIEELECYEPNKPELDVGNQTRTGELEVLETREPKVPELVSKPKSLATANNREPIKPKIAPTAQELREEMELLESQCRDVNKTGMIPKQRLHMLDDCESNKSNRTQETGQEYADQNYGTNDYRGQNNDLGYQLRIARTERRESKSDIIFGNPELATNMHQMPNKIEMLPGNLKLPMTDGLTTNEENKSLNQQDPKIIKERCKHCSKYDLLHTLFFILFYSDFNA